MRHHRTHTPTPTRRARRAAVTTTPDVRRYAGPVLAVLIMCAAVLFGDVTPAPADARPTTPVHGATAGRAAAAPVTPWTTPCAEEDSSDCTWDAGTRGNGDGSTYTTVRTAPGAVCVYFPDAPADAYCTGDDYPPAGAPSWGQVSGREARAMASTGEETVDYWGACAVSFDYGPHRDGTSVVCPDGWRYADVG